MQKQWHQSSNNSRSCQQAVGDHWLHLVHQGQRQALCAESIARNMFATSPSTSVNSDCLLAHSDVENKS